MTNCTSTIMSKLTQTMDYILGSCMPKVELDEDEATDALGRPKDDNYRKQELKQLVGMFSSRAQSYIDCTILSLLDNRRLPAYYKLDSMLRTFTINTDGRAEEIPISDMRCVLNYDDIRDQPYAHLLDTTMISSLSLHEKNRLVLIEYDSKGRNDKLIMLVEEVGNSDPLVTVLRILKMYANDRADGQSPSGTN